MNKKLGFTLAEVLITLGVIGVVAVITLPVVLNKINDKIYESGRVKALSIIGTAVKILASQDRVTGSVDAEDFVNDKLSEQISIVQTCPNNKLENCGLPPKIKIIKSVNPDVFEEISMPKNQISLNDTARLTDIDGKSYGFVMNNGYSVNLFYNPNCIANVPSTYDSWGTEYKSIRTTVCVNAIYDINGKRGPNTVGKDIGFVTVLYPDLTSVAVAPVSKIYDSTSMKYYNAQDFCSEKGYSIPTLEEAIALGFNNSIIYAYGEYMWTSTPNKNNLTDNWVIRFYSMSLVSINRNSVYGKVTCVKK